MKIVLVDDEMIVRVGIKSLLDWGSHGHQIVADVADGEQALEAIYRYRPDVVITDMKMPVMDGNALIREINKLPPPRPKVIVLSSYSDFELVKEALRQGAQDYILKMRMEPKDLLAALHQVQAGLPIAEGDGGREEDRLPGPEAILSALKGEALTQAQYAAVDRCGYHLCLMTVTNLSLLRTDPEMIRRSVQNIVQEILCQAHTGLCATMEDQVYALVLMRSDTGDPGDVHSLCPQIGEKLGKYLNLQVMWSKAERCQGAAGLAAAYGACASHLKRLAPALGQVPAAMPRVIRSAIAYIHLNYAQDISLDDVANNASMSVSYFSTLFRSETGHSFVDTLNTVRVEKAKELLDDPSIRIYEVADRVGYKSSNYFNRVFKKAVGMTPVQYRNR